MENIYIDLIYRSNVLQSGGSFKNSRGREINYESKYLISGDIIVENKAIPVTLKTRSEDKEKFEKLFKDLVPYEHINCECILNLYGKTCNIILINAKKV